MVLTCTIGSPMKNTSNYSRGRRWAYYILRRKEENSVMKGNNKTVAIAFGIIVISILIGGSVLLAYYISSGQNDSVRPEPLNLGFTTISTTDHMDQSGSFPLSSASIPACTALLPYTTVQLPNYFGHTTIADLQVAYQKFLAANLFSCSPESELFICALLLPQVNSNRTQPCATYCHEAVGKCRGNFTATLNQLGLSELQCEQFPLLQADCFYYCDREEFTCSNGFCVPKESVCDGVNNCGDSSDETVCQTDCSDPLRFRCVNSPLCLSRRHICDQHVDCPNGDDEKNCSL